MSEQTILIADDDRAIRTVLSQALGRAGYNVRATSSAATLWRWVEDGEGDLVITDVVMPEVNGPQLAEAALRRRPDLKVLFATGNSRNTLVRDGVLEPGVQLIGKPFTVDALGTRVRAVLAAEA